MSRWLLRAALVAGLLGLGQVGPGPVLLPTAVAVSPRATCVGRAATIVGTPGHDVLTGTPGPDVIVGLGGDDRIFGLGSDDVLCGGRGSDLLVADAGHDLLWGGRGSDRLRGGAGSDLLRGGQDLTHDGKILAGDDLDGGPGSDRLEPGHDPLPVAGQGSPDILRFTYERTGIVADLSRSPGKVRTATGTDTVRVTGTVWLVGSDHPDTVTGSSYGDWLDGNRGGDTLRGGPGNDLLDELGDSTVAHNDRDTDSVLGGPGNDTLATNGGPDRLRGGPGDDALVANGSQPGGLLSGDGGDDEVFAPYDGRTGRSVTGGPGRDVLTLDDVVDYKAHESLLVDAGSGQLAGSDPDRAPEPMSGFEKYVLYSVGLLVFRGTEGRDVVDAAFSDGALHAQTLGGDDLVLGTREPDRIEAGAGTDTVRAWIGRDTCLDAERTTGCEITH